MLCPLVSHFSTGSTQEDARNRPDMIEKLLAGT